MSQFLNPPTEFPLSWPLGRPRTRRPVDGRFDTSLSKAVSNVQKSLRLFGEDTGKAIPIALITISSNVGGLSGRPPEDPAVAVYFIWDGKPQCIAVDRYKKVQHNLQAIYHLIEARRIDYRHGGLHFVRASFDGHKALPAPAGHQDCFARLGLDRTADAVTIRAAAKRLAMDHHPDRPGGSSSAMAEINAARDAALAEAQA